MIVFKRMILTTSHLKLVFILRLRFVSTKQIMLTFIHGYPCDAGRGA